MKAVLFKSMERFLAFQSKLINYGIDVTVLGFDEHEWLDFDYSDIDLLIYYPSFKYSSNHPLALHEVYDNLNFLHESYPNMMMFPDPNGIKYYSDKYRQYLFLKHKEYPMPLTIPLFSEKSVTIADSKLGYPMVIKNRFGAGGGSVFRVFNKNELIEYYRISQLDLFNIGSVRFFSKMLTERLFYWQLIKARKARYPFLSPPLLAQEYIDHNHDLKTVVGCEKVVEAHWRYKADDGMWKVNIDGGGIGVWSEVPQECIDMSIKLARDLEVSWLNLDILPSARGFLITEFSPVWHHYAYKEKPSFVYKEDYNIDVPLDISLDLERLIVESLIARKQDLAYSS